MHYKKSYFLGFLAFTALLGHPAGAAPDESGLSTAGAGFAPMDAGKAQDPMVPISKSQRDELLEQFKGLVAMGMKAQSYAAWNGKNMADCETSKQSNESWVHKCEIDMPDAVGQYYFYPTIPGGSSSTLQQVDVHVHSIEEVLLKDIRLPLQELLGRGSVVEPQGRHWDTGNDIADLDIDKTAESGSFIHFVWGRAPMIWNNPNALIRTNAYARSTPSTTN